jgi:hypothetical protein
MRHRRARIATAITFASTLWACSGSRNGRDALSTSSRASSRPRQPRSHDALFGRHRSFPATKRRAAYPLERTNDPDRPLSGTSVSAGASGPPRRLAAIRRSVSTLLRHGQRSGTGSPWDQRCRATAVRPGENIAEERTGAASFRRRLVPSPREPDNSGRLRRPNLVRLAARRREQSPTARDRERHAAGARCGVEAVRMLAEAR